MNTGYIMNRRRKELGLSADDVAKALGVSRSTVFRYENGEIEKMPIDVLKPLAKILKTTPAFLMGWSNDSNEEVHFDNMFPIETKKFPLLGEIACGEPMYADEDLESYVTAGTDIEADFCLKCKGDSMINARILDGDIVFIRKQSMVDNGEIAAVIIDNEATLKRVEYFRNQNLLLLKAENPKYETLTYSDETLDQIRILGKAVAFQSDVR